MGPKRSLFARPRLLLAMLMMLIGFGAYAGSAAAQDEVEPEPTVVVARVLLCLEPGCTEDAALTEAVDGVPVEFSDAVTGDPLGSCVTGDLESGACAVDVVGIESVMIALDETAFPEGYVADGNPGTLDLVNGNEYPFLLMPADGFPPDEEEPAAPPASPVADADDTAVAALPATGDGASQDDGANPLAIGAVGLVTIVALGFLGLRLVARRL